MTAAADDRVYFREEAEMLTLQEIVDMLQAQRPYLAAEFSISKIGLFGSYLTGQADETSDIDLIVDFSRPIGFRFLELVDFLEQLFGRKVDILTPSGIKNIRIRRVADAISESVVYV